MSPGQQPQLTLEDGQQAVSSQVPLGIVAELQNSGGAGAPPAGPLLSVRLARPGVHSAGAWPGGGRVGPLVQAAAGRLERRVLDAAALHGARGRCQPRLRTSRASNAPLNGPEGGPEPAGR